MPPTFPDMVAALPQPLPVGEQPPFGVYIYSEELRRDVFALQYAEVYHRLADNPQPTPMELALGIYVEQLEAQVRDAVIMLWDKGYEPTASGFFGPTFPDMQCIYGSFNQLDQDTRTALERWGIDASDTALTFYPNVPDFVAIKEMWDAIARFLPAQVEEPIVDQTRFFPDDFDTNGFLGQWLWYWYGLQGHDDYYDMSPGNLLDTVIQRAPGRPPLGDIIH